MFPCDKVLFILILTYLAYVTKVFCYDNVQFSELPFCDPEKAEKDTKRLVFVSTLDGKLSALNVDDGGSEAWSIPTGPGPMLSSSIHRLELTNNGQWVRMIPSLSGGLYKFNGEDIEPIPITADNLLKSSFRYSDDLVISGGKESRTYGVDIVTGRVLYECSMSRCDNLTGGYRDSTETTADVVLIQRQTQTVRAVEPRTGLERWNFSVGQHDLKIAPNPTADCHRKGQDTDDILLKVIVPDGLICALSKSKPGTVLWQHKFEFPVVSAWERVGSRLQWVNLFGGNKETKNGDIPDSPVLYVGMHKKQLYIQESVTLQKEILDVVHGYHPKLISDDSKIIPSIPWRPVRASAKTLGIQGPNEPILQITDETSRDSTTALSVLYGSEYVNGDGFYLYSAETIKRKETALCNKNEQYNITIITYPRESNGFEEEEETPVKIIIVSMWYWWKEITLLSVVLAIAINVFIQRRFMVMMRHNSDVSSQAQATTSLNVSDLTPSQPVMTPLEVYISRYLTDFEPIHCLGKGGFGIVFQAKNKIDDCHYAIKRIPLPNKEHARKRVMREVKALAKLDHQNIVRYFNAWIECPPTDWQKEQDALWARLPSDDGAITVDLTGGITPISESSKAWIDDKVVQRKRKRLAKQYLESLWEHASSFFTSKSMFRPVVDDGDSDSFIVFQSQSGDEKENKSCESIESINKTPISFSDFPQKVKRPNTLEVTSDGEGPSIARVYLYIQMQLCRKDSLREWLSFNTQSRQSEEIVSIFSQIVKAVEYVHLQGLIHRDLKPSNIFFSPEGQIKVGDFGLVTGMVEGPEDFRSPIMNGKFNYTPDDKHTARVGTQLYMSPEQLEGRQYNYKVDIYSLGLILFELLVPFSTQMERLKILTDVRNNRFPKNFKENHPHEYGLLSQMLCNDPEQRLTTIGIRCRKPLLELESFIDLPEEDWHFKLPEERRRNDSTSKSSSQDS